MIGDRLAGQHLRHGAGEDLPLRRIGAPEIVGHQVAAAQQVLPQARDLGVAQAPPAGLRGVDPGVIEELVVGEAEVARVADIHAREPLQAGGEVVIGGGPIDNPPAGALAHARGDIRNRGGTAAGRCIPCG